LRLARTRANALGEGFVVGPWTVWSISLLSRMDGVRPAAI